MAHLDSRCHVSRKKEPLDCEFIRFAGVKDLLHPVEYRLEAGLDRLVRWRFDHAVSCAAAVLNDAKAGLCKSWVDSDDDHESSTITLNIRGHSLVVY